MHDSSDKVIFINIKNDDEQGLKILFDRYFIRLVNTAYKLTSDRNLAEDIAQEVFIKFWNKRADINLHTSLYAYLHRMTINESLACLRRQKRIQNVPVDEDHLLPDTRPADEPLIQGEMEHNIEQAIDKLPEKCGVIFKLSRYENLSYKEIASELNISVKTVENQVSKALRYLRETLKDYLYGLFF